MHFIESMNKLLLRILDAGSSSEVNLTFLSKFGNAFGENLSPQAIEFCRRSLKKLVLGSLEKVSFKTKTFDPITYLDMPEHTFNPLLTLIELRNILQEDGRMTIAVPAFKFL